LGGTELEVGGTRKTKAGGERERRKRGFSVIITIFLLLFRISFLGVGKLMEVGGGFYRENNPVLCFF
jgi:hypothetical protein